MSNYDQFIQQSLLKYKNPDIAKRDILFVLTSFNQLCPKVDKYVFTNGTSKDLLQLDGTIPVTYKGSSYNIPICIWIMDLCPYDPPMVYVRPTSTMQIKSGKNVDQNGKVDLPYLREWRYPNSDLIGLIQILAIVFGAEPPVYSRAQQPQFPASNISPYPTQNGSILTNNPAYRAVTNTNHLPANREGYPQLTGSSLGQLTGYPNMPDDNLAHGHLDTDIEKAKYNQPAVVTGDVHDVVAAFKDFRSSNENVLGHDGSLKNLLQLHGTIPTVYKRKKYSIPILVLIMDDHPYDHPTVYVRPTSTMYIKPGRSVDKNGKVDIPYLKEWSYPDSDPVTMIHALILTFSEELPLMISCGTTSKKTQFVPRLTTRSATDSVLLGSDEA